MSLFDALSYARDYYYITPNGEVVIQDTMPDDMRERFLKDVEIERQRCKEAHAKGIFSSTDVFHNI